ITLEDNADSREMPRPSGELREVVGKRAPDLAGEHFRQRGNRAGGLVERDALDPGHGEEQRGQPGALALGAPDLADELVEGGQLDAPQGQPGGIDSEELAPQLFLGGVQADHDDRARFHSITPTFHPGSLGGPFSTRAGALPAIRPAATAPPRSPRPP